MNEEAVQYAFDLFVKDGYGDSIEDFKNLLKTNPEALSHSYNLFVKDGYGDNIDDFKTLIGVDQQPTVAVQPTVKKKDDMDSDWLFGDGSSESEPSKTEQGTDLFSRAQFALGIKQPQQEQVEPKKELDLAYVMGTDVAQKQLQEKMTPQREEYLAKPLQKIEQKAQFEQKMEKIEEATPEYLRPSIRTIEQSVEKSLENFVGDMNYQFSDAGFEFKDLRNGYFEIKAPDGTAETIRYHRGADPAKNVVSASVNYFIKTKSAPLKGIDKIEKMYKDENKKFATEYQVESELSLLSKEQERTAKEASDFLKRKQDAETALKAINELPFEKRTANYRDDKFQAEQIVKRIYEEGAELQKKIDAIPEKQKNLEIALGKYNSKQEKQGTWVGGIYNSMLSFIDGTVAGATDIAIDYFANFNPLSGYMTAEQKDKLAKDMKYGTKDELTFMEGARNAFRTAFGDKNTSEQWESLTKQSFVGGAVLGAAEFVPSMLIPGAWFRRAAMYASVNDMVNQEFENNPELQNVSENEKLFVKVPIGIVGAVLEEYGVKNIVQNTALVKSITGRAILKATEGMAPAAFKKVVSNEISEMIADGTLRILGGGIMEFETGAAQQGVDIGVKSIFNAAKGKKLFDTPDTVVEIGADMALAGAQEMIGSVAVSTPMVVAAAYRKKDIAGIPSEYFNVFVESASDKNAEKAFIATLKNNIISGDMTNKEAVELLNNYRNSVGLLQSIPPELNNTEKKQAMNLLRERKELEEKTQGKDPALVKPIQDRINKINEQLTQLTQDAIQKQAAGEVSVQPEAGAGQEVEVGGPEAKPKITPEESKRKEALIAALEAYADSEEDSNIRVYEAGVLEELQKKDVQAELDAIIAKEQAVPAEGLGTQLETVAKEETPAKMTTTEVLISTPTETKAGVTFVAPNGNEVALEGNEQVAAQLYDEAVAVAEEQRTPEQNDIIQKMQPIVAAAPAVEVTPAATTTTPAATTTTPTATEVTPAEQQFTEQDRARKAELEEAMRKADKRRKNITVGETTMPKAEAKAELDALNQKEQATQQPVTPAVEAAPTATAPVETMTAEQEADLLEELMTGKKKETAPTETAPAEPTSKEAIAKRLRGKKNKGLMSSIDFGISQTLYNGALEFMASQVEKGTKLGNAIENTIKWIDEKMQGKSWDKDGFTKYANTTFEEVATKKKAKAILDVYPKGSVVGIADLARESGDTIISNVLSKMKDVFNKVKISGRRPTEGAAFYNYNTKEIDVNKNSPHWDEVEGDQIASALSHEFAHHLIDGHSEKEAIETDLQEIKDDLIANKPELTESQKKAYEFMTSKNNSPQEILTYAVSDPDIRPILTKYKDKLNNISNKLFGEDVISGIFEEQKSKTNEIQPQRTRDGRGRTESRAIAPLEGAPSVQGFVGPEPQLTAVAEEYAKENGIPYKRQAEYVKVDEDRAKRIAEAYEEMKHDPQNPKVKEAYENLIKQTIAQYEALVKAGYKFWFIDTNIPSNLEYAQSPFNAMRDVRSNKQMGVFPTTDGFGSSDIDVSDNLMMAETKFKWPVGGMDGELKPVLANDLFRAVHDAFGHGLEGAGFRARGEENAWQAHIRLFTGSAVGAITSETRGQNSWLNFGPHGEKNRTANTDETIFADQKTGLMPEWTWKEGVAADMETTAKPFATSLADAIVKNLTIKTGGLQSNILGVPIAIWNAGVKTMAAAVKAGAAINEAVQKAIEYIKENHGKKFNEAAAEKKLLIGQYKGAIEIAREAKVTNEGLKTYFKRQGLTDAQIETLLKVKEKAEKKPISKEKVIGKPKPKKVTVNEMTALKDQIRLEARAAREAKGDLNAKRKMLTAAIKEMKKKGSISVRQAKALINRVNAVNLDNPVMVERLLDYAENIFNDADYDTRVQEVRKLQEQVKKVNHVSMKDTVREFASINPERIPADKLLDYIQALDDMNTRTPFYEKMNDMFDEVMSYKSESKEFDAIKTFQALIDKLESIAINQVKSVEDYVALVRDINSFKRKAYQLLQNGDITQEQYDQAIENVGKDQAAVEKKYEKELTALKKGLVQEIMGLKPEVHPDFTPEEAALINKYLELSEADLKSLSPEDLYILNDLLNNIKEDTQLDYYRLSEIVSKAYTNVGGQKLAEQLNESKFNKSSDEGKKLLLEQESAFWEGLLGLGRATSGALQKFIVSPFNRAIASYENMMKDGYYEFSKLKKKYKMKDYNMHRLGMFATYLQEYMAQFDSANKDVKDIGTRDWFGEIISNNKMRNGYKSAKPSLMRLIGFGDTELKTIEKIYNSLPKDANGKVNPKAVYDSFMANDSKFFTKKEKAFFDKIMDWKQKNLTTKQKAANEMNGMPFKEIPFHMMRVRLDRGAKQISPKSEGGSGVVRIEAGTGKERAKQTVGPIMTNFEQLFSENLEQTARNYYLQEAINEINNTLSVAKKNLKEEKEGLFNTIPETISEALNFEFDKTESQSSASNLLAARAAETLLNPIRTAVELLAAFGSYPTRAKTPQGYKDLFGKQGQMKKLLDFTSSPLRLRENINKAIDISDGRIKPKGKFEKALNYLSGLPERTMLITSWMPTFNNEFKDITGVRFDMDKFKSDAAYRQKYGKAIKEAAAVADAQTEKIIGSTTKAGGRREYRIAPKILANIFGLEGTVKKNTTAGQILGFFTNYPYREVTEFLNGFKEAAEVYKQGGGVIKSVSQLQKPLGVVINLATYGFLSSVVYAMKLMLLGDDEDEEKGEGMLKELMTPKGFMEELEGNAISLAASKYAAGGKAMLQLTATVAYNSTSDEERKAKIKKLLKNSVFVEPIDAAKVQGYGGKNEVLGAIASYVPQVVLFAKRIEETIQTAGELNYIYKKFQDGGLKALSEDEGLAILAIDGLLKSTQALFNFRYGTSLPMYNDIKMYMKGAKKEAGVGNIKLSATENKHKKALQNYKNEKEFKENDPEGYLKAIDEGGSLYEYKLEQSKKEEEANKDEPFRGMSEEAFKKKYPEEYIEKYGPDTEYYEEQRTPEAIEKRAEMRALQKKENAIKAKNKKKQNEEDTEE